MVIRFTPSPTANAGTDQTVCADAVSALLNGSVTVATGGTWSIITGTGSFNPGVLPLNVTSNSLTPDYLISLADTAAKTVTLQLTTTGNGTCNAVSDQMTITITPAPLVNANVSQTICADAAGINLSGSVLFATGGAWTSSGTGVFTPNPDILAPSYDPSASDRTNGSVILTLTSTGNGTCNAKSDSMTLTITPIPTADAGPDLTACSNNPSVSFNGSVTVATSGTWTTSGSGTFNPAAPNNLAVTYNPSAADIAAGSVVMTLTTTTGNGTCNPVTDNMVIRFTPSPTANAGTDQTVCADAVSALLNGSVTVATGGTWSIITGTGSFNPGVLPLNVTSNSLTPDYLISLADTAAKTVTLQLTTTGNGTCNAVSDQMTITITPAPLVNANVSQTICADAAGINLSGSVLFATGGAWTSSGTGVFTPNPDILAPSYDPSASDRTNGSVILTLTSTGNGTCNAKSDSMKLTITPAPTANAGPDQTVCGNNPSVSLNGSVTIATSGTWKTSGSGTFNPAAPNNLAVTYNPSAADIAAGSVLLTLTTTGNGTCNPVTDNMVINFTTTPTINAGPDKTVCGNNAAVSINASVTVATGGSWVSTGSGTFSPNNNSLTFTYTPSAADIAAKTVTLTVTSTGNGTCIAVTDNMVVTITDKPTSAAGAATTVCADIANGVALNGGVTNATGGIWTTAGTGTFSPDAAVLNATYFPSTADKTAGTVGLTLTTSGMGNCLAVTSTRVITITKAPTANAGLDKSICADAAGVSVIGTVTIATSGTWTTSGTGTFNPAAPNTLSVTYIPSAADIAAGVVDLTLTTTTGNGTCNPVTDQMRLTITPKPTVNAGTDKTVCADLVAGIPLHGTVTTATGGSWTSPGGGIFNPSANALTASYQPTPAEKTAGTVTLTLTTTGNGTCNAYNDQIVITITPAPIVSTGAASACADSKGLQLNGTVTNAAGGQWSTSGSGTFSPNAFTIASSYTPSAADIASGFVVLTLTSTGNGTCNPVPANMNLIITPLPISDGGPDERVCRGTNTDLIALQQSANNSYKWFTMTNAQISSIMSVTVAPNTDSSFILQATDNKGCSTRDTVELFMVDPPAFNLPAHFCLVLPLTMNSQPVGIPPTGSFQWFENGNKIIGATDTILNPVQVGTYIVEFLDGKCSAYDTTIVTLPPQLFSPDTLVCASQVIDIKTTNVPGATYSWSKFGTGGAINGASNTFQINVTATSNNNDSTDFVVTVTDALTCSSLDTIKVKTVPLITLNLLPMNACVGDSVILNGSPGFIMPGAKYNWFSGPVPTAIAVPDTTSQLKVKVAGTYYLDFIAGGCIAKDTSIVAFNPKPVIALSDVKFCFDLGAVDTLVAGKGPAGDPFISYHWFTKPDTIGGTRTNEKFAVKSGGKIYVTVENANLCKTTDSLNVIEVCPPRFVVPTAFFPSGNPGGIDPGSKRYQDLTFRPFSKFVKNIQFTVFNRWGEIIFYTEDPTEGWDGMYRGVLMETGTYPWTFVWEPMEDDGLGRRHEKGAVTILKAEE
jgi:hypothetical protein